MRPLAPLAMAAAAALAGCGGDATAPAGKPLLPDLDQAVPLAVSLSRRGGRDLVVFVHVVNPDRAIEESDYANNTASALVELRRPPGRPPTLEVVARCPDTARCSA